MLRMLGIPYLAYHVAERNGICGVATRAPWPPRSAPMIASFLLIFVAFALCQALLTVKFADVLSSVDRVEGPAANTSRPIAAAKLA